MDELSLERLRLVDAAPEAAYDNFVELALQTLGAPVALVSIVQHEKDRQFFKSQRGLPEPWASDRQTPLSHSFCRHVVASDDPLVVEDARRHPLVKDNPAVRELGVVAYLGAPVRAPGGTPVGSLCVIDSKPRRWDAVDLERITRLASCVSDAIRLQASLNAGEALRAEQRAFTYALSHELRSPLATARVLLDELGSKHGPVLNAEEARLLRMGGVTLDDACTLLDDVLQYTRTLCETFDPGPVSLSERVQHALATLRQEIADSGATFTIGRLPEVFGDADQLQTLVLNLISNAVRYACPGTAPLIRIEARTIGQQVELCIADNGLGLAAEHRESVFELFRRQHAGAPVAGSGLGLTVCRRIVANHHGTIRFVPTAGTGACLTIRLPALDATAGALAA